MLGNGVKRKLHEDEDGLEEEGLAAAPVFGGVSRGPSYALQRQTVLNMSLVKLYGPRAAGPDPGLQRRVLINNTIRHIHEEFKQEGGGGGVRAALFFAVQPAAAPLPPPPSSSSFAILSSLESPGLTPASLLDEEDSPLFFALPPPSSPHPAVHHGSRPPSLPPPLAPLPPSPKDSFSTALEEIGELCPTVVVAEEAAPSSSSLSVSPPYVSSGALSSPPATPALSVDVSMKEAGQNSQEEEEEEEEERAMQKPAPPLPPPSTTDSSSSPTSFLTDFALDDILFTDIDTSMYDFGPGGASPSVTSASKMAPVVMADDLVKTISGYGGGGSQNQPFKMDLAELDHIMEVLVGS